MFRASLFITAQKWTQPACPATCEWINTTQYVYSVENYSAMKRNELLINTIKCMNLKSIIMLSERKECTYFMIPFTGNIQKRPIYRDRK